MQDHVRRTLAKIGTGEPLPVFELLFCQTNGLVILGDEWEPSLTSKGRAVLAGLAEAERERAAA